MTLICDELNPLRSSRWDELAQSTPDYSCFHSSNWARVLHDSYGYEPVYLALSKAGQTVALIPFMTVSSLLSPRRGVSLPFSDYCEPLLMVDNSGPELLDWLIGYSRRIGWKTMELRGGNGHFPAVPRSCTFYRHQLDLTVGEDGLLSGLRDSTRRNIMKAIKQGVEIRISTTGEALQQFCLLNCLTRRQHGLPPQPYSFFKNIQTHIIGQGHGIVVLASYRKRLIAGAVYFHCGDQALYKYGASDRDYQQLRANNLVMWEALRWYERQHARTLCFGRTETDNQGLLQFKTGWGATEKVIGYYLFDVGRQSFVEGNHKVKGWQSSICRKLPLPILRLAGAILYKSAG